MSTAASILRKLSNANFSRMSAAFALAVMLLHTFLPAIAFAVSEVKVSEFMANPGPEITITDSEGEWIELHNSGNTDQDLSGWTLNDGGSETLDLNGTILANDFFVVCRNDDATQICDQIWSEMSLANSGDTITLNNGSTDIDTVNYAGSDVNEAESTEINDDPALNSNDSNVYNTNQTTATSTNTGTPGTANSNWNVKNIDTGENFSTIQAAIDDDDTTDNHTLFIKNGTYDENPNLDKSLTLEGESETGVIIVSDDGGYGLENTVDRLDMTFKNFTLTDATNSSNGYGIKLTGSDVTIENVTVKNSDRSEFDFNGMNSVTLRNITADGNNTAGVGVAFTNSHNIDLDGATTTGNDWGGVALYPYGTDYPQGINSAMIYNLDAAEDNELFQQVGSGGSPVSTLEAPQYNFGVTNDEFRPDGDQFTFYKQTLADASNFALGLHGGGANTDSAIHRLSNKVRIVPTSGLTIKAAVEDAPADGVVRLLPGVHDEDTEQIVINKNLRLQGAGMDSTEVQAQFDTGSSGDARGWFLVESGSDVVFRGMTLNGDDQKIWQAIRHRGSGVINELAFKNILFNESGPNYAGTAIAAFGDGATDILNSNFDNIGRIGVLYFGSGVADSRFNDNTYTGKGSGDWLDYALDISAGASVRVARNTITNNLGVASSDGSTSAGVLVSTFFGPNTTARLVDNIISNNSTGVFVGYNDSDTSTIIARNNEIVGNDSGAISTNTLADFRQNWWGDNSGPTDTDDTDGSIPATNPGGTGDSVEDNIWYSNWIEEDTTPPSVPDQIFPSDGAVLNANDLYVDWGESSDNTTDQSDIRYEYRLYLEDPDDNPNADTRYEKDYTGETRHPASGTADGTPEDTYYWRVRACDQADNCSEWTQGWEFTVDNTDPIAEIASPTDGDVLAGTVNVVGEVTDSNPMNSYIRIEGPNSYVKTDFYSDGRVNHEFNWNTSGLDNGEYTIYFEARDKANNKDGSRSNPNSSDSVDMITVTVDNKKPSISVDSPETGDEVSGIVTVNGAVTDNNQVANVEFRVLSEGCETPAVFGPDDITFGSGSYSYDFDTTQLADGIYCFKVTARDEAGNKRFVEVENVIIDNTAPTADAGNSQTVTGQSAVLDGSDSSDDENYNWTQQSGPGTASFSSSNSETTTVTVDTYGTYSFLLEVEDEAGNTDTDTVNITFEEPESASDAGDDEGDDSEPEGNDTGPVVLAANTAGGEFAQVGTDTGEVEGTSDDNTDDSDEDGQILQATDDSTDDNDENQTNEDEDLPWWWWLLILAAIFGGLWLVVARRGSDDE